MNTFLPELSGLDRIIHEPARLLIVSILSTAQQVDFTYLLTATGFTRGNLASHLARLEEAAYIHVDKTFRGRVPRTLYSLTQVGTVAFESYRRQLKGLSDRLTTP